MTPLERNRLRIRLLHYEIKRGRLSPTQMAVAKLPCKLLWENLRLVVLQQKT